MPKPLVYKPLRQDPNEIRLLDLRPAKNWTDDLRGELRHVNLKKSQYAALSYVCGPKTQSQSQIDLVYDPNLLQKITRRKYRLEINSSLSEALRNLRHKYGAITLWCDAICIHQNDESEKSRQVRLMTSIFSYATTVHAWLGRAESESSTTSASVEDAFHVADKIWELAPDVKHVSEEQWLRACFTVANRKPAIPTDNPGQESQIDWAPFAVTIRKAVLSSPSLRDHLPSLMTLSQSSFFTRVWILQEGGRARLWKLHYNQVVRPHRPVLFALCLAHSLRDSKQLPGPLRQTLQAFDERFLTCLAARTTCSEGSSLQDVLEVAYYDEPPRHEAFLTQDLIYGRLGLAKDHNAIDPDYTITLQEFYTRVSRFMLEGGFMDPLVSFKPYSFMRKVDNKTLPSWAYEWYFKGRDTFTQFNAAKKTTQQVRFVPSSVATFGQALSLTGVRIGSLRTIGKCSSELATKTAHLHPATVFRANLSVENRHLSQSEKSAVINDILLASRRIGVNVSVERINKLFGEYKIPLGSFWCWWLNWLANLDEMMRDVPDPKLTTNIAELILRQASENTDLPAIARAFGNMTDIRILADLPRWSTLLFGSQGGQLTEAGIDLADSCFRSAWGMRAAVLDSGYLGYIPEDSRIQDDVVIFHGVKAPLIIREVEEGAHRIIGPAHVCGVMQGEFLDTPRPSERYELV